LYFVLIHDDFIKAFQSLHWEKRFTEISLLLSKVCNSYFYQTELLILADYFQ
jgi:hypothetical protein